MTTDEARKELQTIQESNPTLINDELINTLIKACRDCEWYRSQDLVKREDVSCKMYWLDVEELVQQIAKAEPPKE